jgi:hypothetical protein
MLALVTLAGAALGATIRWWLAGRGLQGLAVECALWLIVMASLASPLLSRPLRQRLIAAIPR